MVKKDSVYTKLFRDGIRHIDFILVIQDDGDETIERIRINFLVHAIRIGLELEVEYGVMTRHRDLMFIKVHAPDPLIEQYGSLFGVRRFFKDTHTEFVATERPCWGVFAAIFNCTRKWPEKDWLQLARKQYPGPMNYSTYERSMIVYKILMTLPFGQYQNYYSMCRLLSKKIFIDAYALHDGPFFFLPRQDLSAVNARQLLYHYWIGYHNWCKTQPICLIQEYFGERVAFYFAFFEYYNFFLVFAGIFGFVTVFMEFFDTTDDMIIAEACTDLTNSVVKYMCPVCKNFEICPFRTKEDYCFHVILLNLIDNPYTVYYSFFISIWGIIFISFWRKRENYLSWIWEIDQDELQHTIRPEYFIDRKTLTRSKWTGILEYFDGAKARFKRAALCTLLIFTCIFSISLILLTLILFKYWMVMNLAQELDNLWSSYFIITIIAVVNVFLIALIEWVCVIIAYKLTNKENHRTQGNYERMLVVRLCGLTFAFGFALLLYFAFLNGALYRLPNDNERWYIPFGLGVINCGPMSCLDEVWIVLVITIICKEIMFKGSWFFFGHYWLTDYNQGEWVNANVPCWEREYRLPPLTEKLLMSRFKSLATQYGLSTLFVSAFPIAPLFALYINLLQIRRDAKLFLLKYRRPTLHKSTGLGAWRGIFLTITYASAITNVIIASTLEKHYTQWSSELLNNTYFMDSDPIHLIDMVGKQIYAQQNVYYELEMMMKHQNCSTINVPASRSIMHILHKALTIALTTRGIIRQLYLKNFWHKNDYSYFEYALGPFFTENYLNVTGPGSPAEHYEKYMGLKPNVCYFPGFRRFLHFDDVDLYLHTVEAWYSKFQEYAFVLVYEHMLFISIIVLHYVIPPRGKDIRQTEEVEQRIKNKYYASKDLPGLKKYPP